MSVLNRVTGLSIILSTASLITFSTEVHSFGLGTCSQMVIGNQERTNECGGRWRQFVQSPTQESAARPWIPKQPHIVIVFDVGLDDFIHFYLTDPNPSDFYYDNGSEATMKVNLVSTEKNAELVSVLGFCKLNGLRTSLPTISCTAKTSEATPRSFTVKMTYADRNLPEKSSSWNCPDGADSFTRDYVCHKPSEWRRGVLLTQQALKNSKAGNNNGNNSKVSSRSKGATSTGEPSNQDYENPFDNQPTPFRQDPTFFTKYLNSLVWKDGSKVFFQGLKNCKSGDFAPKSTYGCDNGFVTITNPMGTKICSLRTNNIAFAAVQYSALLGATYSIGECRYR